MKKDSWSKCRFWTLCRTKQQFEFVKRFSELMKSICQNEGPLFISHFMAYKWYYTCFYSLGFSIFWSYFTIVWFLFDVCPFSMHQRQMKIKYNLFVKLQGTFRTKHISQHYCVHFFIFLLFPIYLKNPKLIQVMTYL